MRIPILFLVLTLFTGLAQAEVRYVSDRLEISLRSGKSTQHRILRMIPSGTRLEVLETDKASGYSRVRTPSGREGWVLTRYLMKVPAARDRLAEAEKRLAELELQSRQRMTRVSELDAEKKELVQKVAMLEQENRKLAQQLDEIQRTASSALAIDSENKTLKARLMEMERNQQTLQQENESLRDRTARDWFMVGAGVILLGIIVGLILPRIKFRKRSSWDTL